MCPSGEGVLPCRHRVYCCKHDSVCSYHVWEYPHVDKHTHTPPHSVYQVPLKFDELICILHRRLCDVTIAHTYIAMAMLKRYNVQP